LESIVLFEIEEQATDSKLESVNCLVFYLICPQFVALILNLHGPFIKCGEASTVVVHLVLVDPVVSSSNSAFFPRSVVFLLEIGVFFTFLNKELLVLLRV